MLIVIKPFLPVENQFLPENFSQVININSILFQLIKNIYSQRPLFISSLFFFIQFYFHFRSSCMMKKINNNNETSRENYRSQVKNHEKIIQYSFFQWKNWIKLSRNFILNLKNLCLIFLYFSYYCFIFPYSFFLY